MRSPNVRQGLVLCRDRGAGGKPPRYAAVIAAALLVLQPAVASADTLSDLKVRIAQAQASVQQLTTRKAGQQNVVEQLRGITGTRASELQRVDSELIAAINRYRQAETDLEQVEAETARLEARIAAQEEAVRQRAGVYGTRLRALYKFTRTSPPASS
jgi:septal ring factor EnvC (AmiA/AmiB activator)